MTNGTLSIDKILRGYEQTRLNNKRLLQERTNEVYTKLPRVREIDLAMRADYLKAARLKVSGTDEDIAEARRLKTSNRTLAAEKLSLLQGAGYPDDYLLPIYKCQVCKDTGFFEGRKCSCFISQIIDALYLESNLKNVLEKENFSTFSLDFYSREPYSGKEYSPYENITNIIDTSKSFIKDFDDSEKECGNILIYGETGLGKTFLTNCIAKELLDRGHSVLYLSANELFENVLAEYIMNRKSELEDLYNYIYNSELLVIDDLGTELTNNFVLSQLFEIINKRRITGLSTLISTNLSMKQLRDRYSERIMSRIIADYMVFNIYGDNIRYQKRKKAIRSVT